MPSRRNKNNYKLRVQFDFGMFVQSVAELLHTKKHLDKTCTRTNTTSTPFPNDFL